MAASGLVLVPVEVTSPTSLHGLIPSLEPIQIYLVTPGSNSVIPMRVKSSDTIASVKLRIQAYKGFYTKHQRLVYGGRELDRDNKTITDYGVSHGEILHLVLRLSDLIDVTVKTSGGKEYLFQVEKNRNVGDLKQRISEREGGLAPDAQQLVLRGQNLEDQRCVDDLCLHDDVVVHLYVRRTAKVRTRYVGRDVELSITAEELVVPGKKGVVNAEKENVQVLPQKKYTIRQLQPSYNAGYYVEEVSKSQQAKQTLHVLEQARGILPFQIPDILLDILAQAKAGIQGGYSPTLAAEGSGGSYFLKSSYGIDNVAIFKPVDEEPCAVNNPRGFSSSSGGEGLKKGTRVGEGAFREVAAYLLDHPIDGLRKALGSYTKRPMGFAGVPPTMMVRCAHEAFHYAPDSYDSVKKAKWGSLQQFVHAFSSCEEMGSASFDVEEVHKIAVLDMRLANTDRNGGNILVCRDENNSLRLVPIDHGYCLPEKVSIAHIPPPLPPHASGQFILFYFDYSITRDDRFCWELR